MKDKVTLNGREVDPRSINIEKSDIVEAQWMNDGTALTNEELEQLTEELA